MTRLRVGRPLDPPRQRDPNPRLATSSFAPTLQLGACPRCTGDLSIDRDIYGVEILCLQCGHRVEDLGQIKEETARLNALYRPTQKRVINGARM